MSCQYCGSQSNDFVIMNSTVEYSGIEIALSKIGSLRVRVCDGDSFDTQEFVDINFCPKCGRILK